MNQLYTSHSHLHSVPYTRIDTLLNLIEMLKASGVPAERYVEQVGIPPTCLEQPDTSIPLILAGRFFDLVSQKEGIEDFGLKMGFQYNALEDFGTYSVLMRKSPTCLSYLENGSKEIGQLITGTALWLSWDIKGARFNILHPGVTEGWGVQPALFMLAATLSTLRQISPNQWTPKAIHLPHGMIVGNSVEQQLEGIPVLHWSGPISFRIETDLLSNVLSYPTMPLATQLPFEKLPVSLSHSVEQTVWLLLQDGRCTLDNVCEMTGIHSRQLQRLLKREGSSFKGLLKAQRHRIAVDLLGQNQLSITEIATQLGYADSSNFTRAFRQTAGCPPKTFRQEKT